MPPDTNTGSFGAGLGGVDALKSAMQRRGMDASVLDQVSASAPTGPSPVAPSPQGGMSPQGQSVDQTLQPVTPQGQEPEQQPRSAEMDIALRALRDTVKTENKIAEQLTGLR